MLVTDQHPVVELPGEHAEVLDVDDRVQSGQGGRRPVRRRVEPLVHPFSGPVPAVGDRPVDGEIAHRGHRPGGPAGQPVDDVKIVSAFCSNNPVVCARSACQSLK